MAGYSGTSLDTKLGIKAGHRLLISGAPDGFIGGDLIVPPGVDVLTAARPPIDVAVVFVRNRAELEKQLPALLRALPPDGALWVSWPKRASKVPTDMTEDVVRDVCLPLGLVDNKVCAVNDVWSGLRLVVRKENRATWPGGG